MSNITLYDHVGADVSVTASPNHHSPLRDRFGRVHTYLRISVTDRCNLRCRYCIPHDGVEFKPNEELLTDAEILRLARIFVSKGVTKIRITGGEPLVRPNLTYLIEQLSSIDDVNHLCMTTNGLLLKDHAVGLKKAGLQSINLSLDTLQKDRFLQMTQRDRFEDTMEGLDAALAVGFDPLKINVVVQAGINDDEVMPMVQYFKDKPVNLRFIEFMPFKNNQWSKSRLVPYRNLKAQIEEYFSLSALETEKSAVAKDFQMDGFPASVSFITSMTDSFCGTCNRIRLTAEGHIKSCLFHPPEMSLRDAMRTGADDVMLMNLMDRAIMKKQAGHDPVEELAYASNGAMISIGG